ncbi:MAG: nucleotidyltransferase domain-containing protein [Legionella sp.]|nr:nucleotidyltransferase domain-containing protein [Legionella sp.]
MKTSWQNDKILGLIVEELKTIYHCHTIILYGSRARGDFQPTSDYDVAGIRPKGDKKWIARFDEKAQVFHDIFIFSENEIVIPNETHLQMSDGIIIIDHNNIGKHLLETLKTMENEPLPITIDEIQARKIWYQKMLARAQVGDLEGKYRYIWSIFTILEDYFAFKKLRYHGPKKAFQYLAKYDQEVLKLFEQVLSNTNDIKSLKKLIEKITGLKPLGA